MGDEGAERMLVNDIEDLSGRTTRKVLQIEG